jgi:lipid II:glycine glycyltransferase (peptidoglycan interpeptide bridge formation enzyme)
MMRGPGVANAQQFREIVEANKTWEKLAFAIKMEPPITESVKTGDTLIKVPNIQPNANTVIVDLSKDEDEIMASFRQRARREIRAAAKDGISVKKVAITDKTIDQMFNLYQVTGNRAGFFIRPKTYYANFWRQFAAAGEGDLYFAYTPGDEQPIAGAFVCTLGKKALYKDGGSRRSGAKHFAHFLQWEIMRDLKSRKITQYDLHGVPPDDQLNNPNHPLAGLAMFKLSFTSQTVDYAGAYDQILRPKIYRRWIKFGQRFYQVLSHHLRKTTLY